MSPADDTAAEAADSETPANTPVDGTDAAAQPPVLFRIEAGNPTPEDIAVLTLVIAAAASGGEEEPAPKPVLRWSSPALQMRHIGRPGYGAWRAEAFPR